VWRANPSTGILEKLANGKWYEVRLGRQAFMHSELDRFLCSLEIKSPIHVRHTGSIHETAVAIWNLYHWFTSKEWSEHKSFNVLYNPVQSPVGLIVKPSLVRRVASQLDGVGWERSGQVAKHFGSVVDLAIATEKDWDKIPGIGKVLSKRIAEAINGR
jgi:ERCC4-type nuclease